MMGPIHRIEWANSVSSARDMAVYLARSCPMCRDYFGVVIGESQSQSQVRPVRGRCANCGYQINWALIG
jgi:hypothetical protein